jgi:hypothetical protein
MVVRLKCPEVEPLASVVFERVLALILWFF